MLEAGDAPISLSVLESKARAVSLARSLGFEDRPWLAPLAYGPRAIGLSRNLCRAFAIGSAAKGCGSRLATLTMVFKLAREVERHWRKLNGSQILAEVIRGVKFVDGVMKKAASKWIRRMRLKISHTQLLTISPRFGQNCLKQLS